MMLAFFAFALLMLAPSGLAQSYSPAVVQATADQFDEIIRTHYNPEISKAIARWRKSAEGFELSIGGTANPELTAGYGMNEEGKRVPSLFINPLFVLNARIPMLYKQLVLEHEFVHICEHFSGKQRFLTEEQARVETLQQRADRHWAAERSATWQQWQSAKKLGLQETLPLIAAAVRQHGEEKGFLLGFYQTMARSSLGVSYPNLVALWYKKVQGQLTPSLASIPR